MDNFDSVARNELTKRIMRRVYLIWGIRLLLHPIFLKIAIALALLWRSTAYISYADVLANAPDLFDVSHSFAFAKGALLHTENSSLLLLSGIFIVGFWTIIDLIRHSHHKNY